jgi:ABC-type Fe3+ transport system substrate-binding protein
MCRESLSLVCLACLLAGCAARGSGGSADELLIASPHRDEIREEIEHAFRPWYQREVGRAVQVIWLDLGGSSNIQRYIAERLARGNTAGFDVFFGGGSDPYVALKRSGYLERYRIPAELLEPLPRDIHGVPLYDPDHTWYGAALSTFGILYNREALRRVGLPEPRTWEDLAAPAYRGAGRMGWIGLADPRHSGSVHMIYEIILQAYGWERGYGVLARMTANGRGVVRESSSLPREVQTGDTLCAPVVEFYGFSLMAREGEHTIGFVVPDRLTVINPDGVAIVRGAPNRSAAEAFVRFIVSEAGQRIWLQRRGTPGGPQRYDLGRLSLLPKLYDLPREQRAAALNPFQMSGTLHYDGPLAGKRWNPLNDFLGATLFDSQELLRQAWLAVSDGAGEPDLIAELTRPTVVAAAVADSGERMRQSPRFRARTIADWQQAARQTYQTVLRKARERRQT